MKIGDIILWILFIISIFVGLWYLFGGPPTFEQTILIFILTAVFGIAISVSKIRIRLKLLENSFSRLARDFKEHIKLKKHK